MSIKIDNPFGQPIELSDSSAASRVGRRIRKIRMEKGLSQAELGAMVDLTADRIQKYENGARKPKTSMLERLADALGVNALALEGPVIDNYIDAMFAFFELEDAFNMRIEKKPKDQPAGLCLCMDFNSEGALYDCMKEWYEIYTMTQAQLEATASEEEKAEILKAYHMWEWSFPQALLDKSDKSRKKASLKRKIDELQKAYDKLDSEEDE